jgi:PAS domain-containing protein
MFDIEYLFKDDNFSGVVILLDKNLNVVKTNKLFNQLQGYKESDLYLKPFVDIIVPEDKSVFFDATFSLDNYKEFTIQCYHKIGAFRYYSFNMINFKEFRLLFGKAIKKDFNSYEYADETQNYLEKAFTKLDVDDISEIVIKDDENMSLFLSMFPIDIWIKDRYNRYIFVNDIYTIHTGHSLEDVYLRDDFQLFPREIAKGFISSDKDAISKGKIINYTFFASTNKLLTWTEVTKIPLYNINKEYIGLIGFSADVSESKSIEENLNQIIKKYEHSFDEIDVIVTEIDLEGKIIFVGGNLVEKLGLKEENILNKNIYEMYKNNTSFKSDVESVFAGKRKILNMSMFGSKLTLKLIPFFIDNDVSSVIVIASLDGETEHE